MRRKFAGWWYPLLAAALVSPGTVAAAATPLPQARVERAVIDALPAWHGKKAQIIDYLDLTQAFTTTVPWALVIAEAAGPVPDPEWTDHGPIAVCLMAKLRPLQPECGAGAYWKRDEGYGWPYRLVAARVVYAGRNETQPLLLMQTCSVSGINGSCSIQTALYRYARNVDSFHRVFVHDSDGSNNNQAARFIEHGPLRGDVVVDYPTDHAPYTYWIEVYAPTKSGRYGRILRYRGRTGYGDHNPLPVADSEMPEILQRLGLWKPGDALPVPARRPEGCARLVFQQDEEWCR